jgi:hypothetical protein
LKDAQVQAVAVKAANASLREETSSGQSRLDRTLEALRIANKNATKARADADAAEATSSSLAQTLNNVQTVLAETKNASQILLNEQQELNSTVSMIETKLMQKEAEILHAQNEIIMLRQSNEGMETSQSKLKQERETLAREVKQYQREVEELNREKEEHTTMEKARKDRTDKVEQEWRKGQTMLVEATAGQAAAKKTQQVLEETIVSLQKANEELHKSLTDQQRIAHDEKHRFIETLGKVETEVQRLRIAAEANDEEMARLKANKALAEKQIQQLKSRLVTLERNLKEATVNGPIASTPASTTDGTACDDGIPITSPNVDSIIPNQLSFHLPPLSATTKEKKSLSSPLPPTTITEKENIGIQNGTLCCICYKPCIGIMKVCQCNQPTCNHKIHMNCIKLLSITQPSPSLSHPGTPAPKVPIILCHTTSTTTTNHHNSSNHTNISVRTPMTTIDQASTTNHGTNHNVL